LISTECSLLTKKVFGGNDSGVRMVLVRLREAWVEERKAGRERSFEALIPSPPDETGSDA